MRKWRVFRTAATTTRFFACCGMPLTSSIGDINRTSQSNSISSGHSGDRSVQPSQSGCDGRAGWLLTIHHPPAARPSSARIARAGTMARRHHGFLGGRMTTFRSMNSWLAGLTASASLNASAESISPAITRLRTSQTFATRARWGREGDLLLRMRFRRRVEHPGDQAGDRPQVRLRIQGLGLRRVGGLREAAGDFWVTAAVEAPLVHPLGRGVPERRVGRVGAEPLGQEPPEQHETGIREDQTFELAVGADPEEDTAGPEQAHGISPPVQFGDGLEQRG